MWVLCDVWRTCKYEEVKSLRAGDVAMMLMMALVKPYSKKHN
jgi:hypothetical protein